ncbi:MAG: hypothetical protein V8S95_00680 [Odoribacter sp.]
MSVWILQVIIWIKCLFISISGIFYSERRSVGGVGGDADCSCYADIPNPAREQSGLSEGAGGDVKYKYGFDVRI